MMLTTKGRYGVMAMVDLALNDLGAPVPLAHIARRQGITPAYLEQIFSRLKSGGLVRSVRGPGGGYVLEGNASDINIASIIDVVDESIKMTRCTEGSRGCMSQSARCLTHDLWEGLSDKIEEYLTSISLEDLCNNGNGTKICQNL